VNHLLFFAALCLSGALAISAAEPRRIVLIAGAKSHGPEGNGIHDYAWSARLLKALLDRSALGAEVRVAVVPNGWPADTQMIETANTIMIISDGRDGDQYAEAPHLASEAHVAVIERQIARGCGFVTLHFSTFAPDRYAPQMLRWSGAYFDWENEGRRDWYSAITTIEADVTLPTPDHPIARGMKPFRMKEEFYYNLRFADPPDPRVVQLLSVPALGGRAPNGNVVAWARTREDGGRSFGTTCGHFYDNWQNDEFRKLMLNAIVWTARIEVPERGVESSFLTREELGRN
jgi:type 1 glutamine amidotransferase